MRLLLFLNLCLACATSQAQNVHSKVGLHVDYLPQFTVQEVSDSNVQAVGIRWLLSDYDFAPWEFGFHAYTGYGEVARASFGFKLAYLLLEWDNHDLKTGLSLSKIDLENIEVNKEEFGPHVGDVSFTNWGTEFKPYLEWEFIFSRLGSVFVQAAYRIINGEKSVVTSVEPIDDPIVKNRITGRNQSFFYSASGVEEGLELASFLILSIK